MFTSFFFRHYYRELRVILLVFCPPNAISGSYSEIGFERDNLSSELDGPISDVFSKFVRVILLISKEFQYCRGDSVLVFYRRG